MEPEPITDREHPGKVDALWHVYLTVAVAIALQIVLPEKLIVGPRFIIPGLEGLLLLALVLFNPEMPHRKVPAARFMAITMIAITSVANAGSLLILVRYLLRGGKADGHELLFAAINLFLTNVIVFSLWYWEVDAGGPVRRHLEGMDKPDFLFPQYDVKSVAPPGWKPTFIDYLYVSLTNATAFSPTDTLPLTHTAKFLMGFQSLISLLTLVLVAARAVNILS